MICGEIYLANYPFTDASTTKVRPVLIVSSDEFNHGQDIVALPISSQPSEYTYQIKDTSPDFRATGLRHTSFVRWTKPLAISKTVIMRRLGSLATAPLSEVRASLQTVFSS